MDAQADCGRSMTEPEDTCDPSDVAALGVGMVANTFFKRRHLSVVMVPSAQGMGYCTTQLAACSPEELAGYLEVLDEVRAHVSSVLQAHDIATMERLEIPYEHA